jgi:enoyl-[acyl-carrier-protein] reductase (NADH)
MLIGANPGADTGSAGANQYRQWGGDIADMAMFLLSEKGSWISGQIFHVDGGMSALRV